MNQETDGESRKGGCLCGAVRYEMRGDIRLVVACHCGQCLKSHGNYAAYTRVPLDRFTLTSEEGLTWYSSSAKARRGFCGKCGSSLFWDLIGSGEISVAAGSIDPPSGLKTSRHIFVQDKGDFYELTDGLEQLPAGQATSSEGMP